MAANIKTIAAAAGVSCATVSRALNGQPGVGPRTRRRIERIAREQGYVPDAQAQALVSGRLPFVGLVVPDITNPYFPAIARGAEEAAFELGYSLLLVDTAWRSDRVFRALDLLTSRRVAGLLLSVPMERMERTPDWERLRPSVVMAGQPSPHGSGLGAVEVDDELGGRLVGEHLAACGWRRVGFLAGPREDAATRRRLAGLQAAVDASGGALDLVAVRCGEWTEGWGAEEAGRLLDQVSVDALFAANDLLALGALRAAEARGRTTGGDLAIVGYDDIDAAARCRVPLTTVAQPTREVGREAVRRLVARIENDAPLEDLRLPPNLVVRASSDRLTARKAI